jgi:hypothetical protein
MVTPGFSLTATERVLPRLALDFLTASLDSRVSVSRALNTATRINSSGLVEIVNANLPRFDFDPVTLACKGLLIEETRVNYCTYSEDFSNADWAKQYAGTGVIPSITSNYAVAPDGNQTADRFIFDIGAGTAAGDSSKVTHAAFTGLTNPHASTVGIWFKSNTANNYVVLLADGYVASTTVTVTPTWQRFTFSNASVSGTASNLFFGIQGNQGTAKYADISVWGGSFEAAAFATSYIPNLATGTTTRNADVASMTGTNFSSWWTSTIGAAVARVLPSTVSGTRPAAQFDDNSSNNIIVLRGNTTNPELYIRATTDQAQIDAGTISANTTYLLGGAWNTNDCAAAVNGGTAVPDTSVTVPTATQARLGSDGTNYLNGCLQSLRYWPQRVTNAEIQAFSK